MYTGRFAPSPTGPLHFGSLVAAAGSFLRARNQKGRWLVRMEDIDPPREVPGAADDILRTLEAFGLEWDGTVLYQSTRDAAYLEAMQQLLNRGAAYYCTCSRKAVAEAAARVGLPETHYPGTCRGHRRAPGQQHAVRVMTDSTVYRVDDAVQGPLEQDLAREGGDFVVRRADGFWAYQLAVVVDDAAQGITEVVRGADLLDSTGRQIHLQRLLGLRTPAYAHLPVVVNGAGEKLSKQTFAPALNRDEPMAAIHAALTFLGQCPPPELLQGSPAAAWRWAVDNFRWPSIPRRLALSFPDVTMAP